MHPVNTLKASRWNSIIMPHRGPCTPLYFPPCEPRRIVGQLVMASSLGLILLGYSGERTSLDDPRPSAARHSFVDDTRSVSRCGDLMQISCLFSPLSPLSFLSSPSYSRLFAFSESRIGGMAIRVLVRLLFRDLEERGRVLTFHVNI